MPETFYLRRFSTRKTYENNVHREICIHKELKHKHVFEHLLKIMILLSGRINTSWENG